MHTSYFILCTSAVLFSSAVVRCLVVWTLTFDFGFLREAIEIHQCPSADRHR
ncbi:hypothetical protein BKA80DRAFT_285584 [Phyllosticta citrichinensis]